MTDFDPLLDPCRADPERDFPPEPAPAPQPATKGFLAQLFGG